MTISSHHPAFFIFPNITYRRQSPRPRNPASTQEPGGEVQTAGTQQSRPLDSAAVKTAHFEQSAPLEMSGQDSGFSAPNKTPFLIDSGSGQVLSIEKKCASTVHGTDNASAFLQTVRRTGIAV